MIYTLFLVGLGAVLALYFSHTSFREKVNDLFKHVKDLFKGKPKDVPLPKTDK